MSADHLSPDSNALDKTEASDETERRAWLERQRAEAPPAGSLRSGQILGNRFTIVRFLARGGMGEVYEAKDHFLKGDRVALKIIGPADPDASTKGRFEKEVLLARQVVHPNVCPIYDIFYCDSDDACACFITMKLLGEESLAQRLRRRRVPAEEAQQITRDIAAGLCAAHEVGVIHRDLKPGNVMVEGSGAQVKAVITDFGLAREHKADLTLASVAHVPGTPGFLAPELLAGQPATPATDLYALGVLLHELFTRRRPVAGQSLNKSIPALYAKLIEACLASDPSVRYRGFQRALEVFEPRRGNAPTLYPLAPSQSQPRWTRRQILGTGATLGCAVAGGFWIERETMENWLHPLPRKRFVAMLPPPPTVDRRSQAILAGALNAIEAGLARAEAADHDLFVISPDDVSAARVNTAEFRAVRDSLGANLVLQASAASRTTNFDLLLRVIDASSSALLREKHVSSALDEMRAVSGRALEAAAKLLDVHLDPKFPASSDAQTGDPAAYEAFNSAEALMKQPNTVNVGSAIEKYKAATEIDPHYALAFAKLAVAYCFLHGRKSDPALLDLARANCQTALELKSDLVEGHQALSFVYENTGNQAKALAEIGTALALDPSNPRTLAWEARIYGRLNRWQESEQTYRRILKFRPNYWPAYNDIGTLENRQGDYQKAIESFRVATIAAPGSALAFNNLGALYLKIGAFRDASDNFEKSLELDPNELAYVNTATALRAQGKLNRAIDYAQKAIASNQADDQNWLELGDCFLSVHGGKKRAHEAYEKAASLADQQLHTDPTDGPGWMLLALYRAKIDSPDDPLALVRRAEALGAADLDSQLVKARVFELLGKRQEALNTLADCFRRGMTVFEAGLIPDFRALKKDPQYARITSLSGAR